MTNNCLLLVFSQIRNNLSINCGKYLSIKTEKYSHNTRWKQLDVLKMITTYYGSDSMTFKSIKQ